MQIDYIHPFLVCLCSLHDNMMTNNATSELSHVILRISGY